MQRTLLAKFGFYFQKMPEGNTPKEHIWWPESSDNKAEIRAFYKDGLFLDADTNKPISLRNGTSVRIITPLHSVDIDELPHHKTKTETKMLSAGAKLHFRLPKTKNEYEVELRENLFIERKGNKSGRLKPCRCVVTGESIKKQPVEAGSLNQAYTRVSIQESPQAGSHTTNVFRTFYYQGRPLEHIRPF